MAYTSEQRAVQRAIIRRGKQRKESKKEIKAALETGAVESGFRNLKGGDRDSAGWRQERASLYKDPTNLMKSIDRFYNETSAVEHKYKKSGDLAAAVQRPAAQYRGRYGQRSREAEKLLRNGRAGGERRAAMPSATMKPGIGRPASPLDTSGAKRSYLQNRGRPGALLTLALSLKESEAVPPEAPARSAGRRERARPSRPGGGSTNIVALGKLARSMGLHVSEHPKFDKVDPVHAKGSHHYQNKSGTGGDAIDVSGPPAAMQKYARRVARRYGKDLEELIWRGPHARAIKRGKKVSPNLFSGHKDHVHAADEDD